MAKKQQSPKITEPAIKRDDNNFRKHTARNKRVLKKSLQDYGAGRSILLDKEDTIIAGNGIFEQSKKLGIPVRVIETDGTELIAVKRVDIDRDSQKRKELAFLDNHACDTSVFDQELVVQELDASFLKEVEFKTLGQVAEKFKNIEAEIEFERIKYPITIVVDAKDYELWVKIKEKIKVEDDRAAFFKIIREVVEK